jgi:hypothetical protein
MERYIVLDGVIFFIIVGCIAALIALFVTRPKKVIRKVVNKNGK